MEEKQLKEKKLKNSGKKLIFIDTETTGLEEDCEIVEVGIKAKDINGKKFFLNELYNVDRKMGVEASMKTGIINKDLESYKKFPESDMFQLLKTLGENDDYVFVAHNIKFDARVLKRYGIELKNQICTMKVSKVLGSEIYGDEKNQSFSMQYLRYYLGFDEKMDPKVRKKITSHRTLGDVLVLELLFNWLLKFIKENPKFSTKETSKIIEKMMEYTKKPIKVQKFTFGKYKDIDVKEVVEKDKGYIEWFLKANQDKPDSEKDEDLLYTINLFLNNQQKPTNT